MHYKEIYLKKLLVRIAFVLFRRLYKGRLSSMTTQTGLYSSHPGEPSDRLYSYRRTPRR